MCPHALERVDRLNSQLTEIDNCGVKAEDEIYQSTSARFRVRPMQFQKISPSVSQKAKFVRRYKEKNVSSSIFIMVGAARVKETANDESFPTWANMQWLKRTLSWRRGGEITFQLITSKQCSYKTSHTKTVLYDKAIIRLI
ncbi:hypothetical protein AVEN_14242-1 [Araneus ventricosus]|uniref:Uncharacterized protein n=1 Tax=Araneus ventricosus TaxID=182803 RepID=A0A4Y2GH94_ARAVE|nr:hypothetical protein AVEN_14242-1 [Araneus ventricosus]